MKNQLLTRENKPSRKIKSAIQKIERSADTRFPKLSAATKLQLIMECLLELTEEQYAVAAA